MPLPLLSFIGMYFWQKVSIIPSLQVLKNCICWNQPPLLLMEILWSEAIWVIQRKSSVFCFEIGRRELIFSRSLSNALCCSLHLRSISMPWKNTEKARREKEITQIWPRFGVEKDYLRSSSWECAKTAYTDEEQKELDLQRFSFTIET